MRMTVFAKRNTKEILRDPLNIMFGLGFPLVVLGLLTAIQTSIPVNLFELDQLTPGIVVFGLSFLTLFAAQLIAKDRTGALLTRLLTTPLKPADYILGYLLPVLPIALAQGLICYLAAGVLGLGLGSSLIGAVLILIIIAPFFIGLGLLCGSIFNDKQVGGICGALLTNVSAWLSGTWFDLELVGGAFKQIAYLLPYVHAVELERAVLAGDWSGIFPHIWWVLGYDAAILSAAIFAFMKMRKKV
ncbi:MAG: ABC transporter permease [Lachnospiraceae bacterium]|nr:ABC transporter permease [Lachnospiraceae bacterium]